MRESRMVPRALAAMAASVILLAIAPGSAAEGAVPGGEVTVLQALEVAAQADPALLAPSSSATLEGQSVQPTISDNGEELSSSRALTSASIAKEVPGQFAVNTPDGELSLTPLNTAAGASRPTVVNESAALFANAWPGVDAIVRPQALGAATILQVRSAQAPTSFSWEVGLGPGQRLEQLANGSVAVVAGPIGSTLETPGEATTESEGSGEEEASESSAEEEAPLESLPPAPKTSPPLSGQPVAGLPEPQETGLQYQAGVASLAAPEQQSGGGTLMVIAPPTATGADGRAVPTSLSVVGNTITANVTTTGVTFPAIASISVAAPSDRASAARPQKLIYGLSDQRATQFGASFDPRLLEGPLHVGVARLVIPYDTALESAETQEKKEKKEKKIESTQNERLAAWLHAVAEVKNAKGEGLLKPYITLWSKSCLKGEACSAPQVGRYRKAVKALIKRYMKPSAGLPAVTMWGAWNEPNGGKTPMRSATAAGLWQVAHSVMVNLHCGCTMVAGEFAGVELKYISRYKKYMVKHHLKPNAWGMHDYHDLIDVESPLATYKNRFAEEFASLTATRLNKPRIWLSEQGVELKNQTGLTRLYGIPELQKLAAEDFLRLAGVSSRTELVDYYQYAAPEPTSQHPNPESEEQAFFDSALKNERGEPRPAYCVLAFENHECTKPPTVITGPVHPLTKNCFGAGNTLELTGEINPNGLPTTYHFEYAEKEGEGFPFKTPTEFAGSGTTPSKVSSTVSVKDPALLCWSITYRLVGVNAGGTTYGETRSEFESI